MAIFKRMGPWAVRSLSHDEAWEKAWRTRFFRKSVPMRAKAIAAQLEDSELLIQHLQDRYPGEASPQPSREEANGEFLRTGTHG